MGQRRAALNKRTALRPAALLLLLEMKAEISFFVSPI
jgi:hypothetical protein